MNEQTLIEIAHYLQRLKNIYVVIDEIKHKNDISNLNRAISLLNKSNTPIENKKEAMKKGESKKKGAFHSNLSFILDKNYENLKGTKVDYKVINTSERVIEFIECHNDTEILQLTTALDLKLLYGILTEEKTELKDKNKELLLQAIKRNIRASKRGEAFSKTF